MSYLNTFIELGILSAVDRQDANIEYQSKIMEQQNDRLDELVNQQQELLNHQQRQDYLKDYIFRVNKAYTELNTYTEKNSLDYYYSLYCLGKGINDSGIRTGMYSEISDKQYFDDCLNNIGKEIYDFVQRNKDKIDEYNQVIEKLDETRLFYELKASEDARKRVFEITEELRPYEKEKGKKGVRTFLYYLPFLLIGSLCIFIMKDDIKVAYFFIVNIIGIFIARIISIIQTKRNLRKLKEEKEYKSLLDERSSLWERITKNKTIIEWGKKVFNINFTDKRTSEEVENESILLENRFEEIQKANALLSVQNDEIVKRFYIVQ